MCGTVSPLQGLWLLWTFYPGLQPGLSHDRPSALYRDAAGLPGDGVLIFHNTSRGGRDGYLPYTYAQAYMNDALWVESKKP